MTLTDNIRQRIAKVQALIEQGATDGEKSAAKAALDRLIKAYNLNEEALQNIELVKRYFSYSWALEMSLFGRIIRFVLEKPELECEIRRSRFQPTHPGSRGVIKGRYLTLKLDYFDFIVVSCAFEYFKKHMKAQWNKEMKADLARCRTAQTRKAKRLWFEPYFLSKYIIASGLYEESELEVTQMKGKVAKAVTRFSDVEGGNYKTQVDRSNHYLSS